MDESNKKVLLAFALSFAVLILWRIFFPPPPPPEPPKPATSAPTTGPPPGALTKATAASPAKPSARVALPVQQGAKAEEIVVENNLARVTFSTEGAVIKGWVLKKFSDESGIPLDVVNHDAAETLGFPMSIGLADTELAKKLNSALYVASPAGSILSTPVKLEFAYSDGKIQVRKVFTFGNGYPIRVEFTVFDGERYYPIEATWPAGFGDRSLSAQMRESVQRVVYGSPDKIESEPQRKVKEDQTIPSPLPLAGMDDRYFACIFIPDSADQAAVRLGRRPWTPPDWKEKEPPKETFVSLLGQLPKPLSFQLFVGPKDLDALKAMKPPLDHLVDYGWFSFVARPLFMGMRYLHDRWTHNYGWAIVLLTVFINMALFPIKLKQIRSAQEMQRIAPVVKGIQDKYKGYKFNDPRKQKMQQEIMKVYQEHHINPLGGCLPMLIQIPFLYGFYRVLDSSIELRHAPWIFWIKDLAAKDHLYILPILMVITSFFMQKLTPMTTADPAQQRMFMLMPLFLGFMFMNFASGLVLYWLTQNIVSIGQQLLINRLVPQPASTFPPRKAAAKAE